MNKLILDSNVFIESNNVKNLIGTYNLFTTNKVLNELKNKKSLEKFNSVSTFIKIRDPNNNSINFVKNFAKTTGDFISLSIIDIEIIALAFELIQEDKKENHINNKCNEKTDNLNNDFNINNKDTKNINNAWNENKDYDSEDEDGWITPENIESFCKVNDDNLNYLNIIGTGIITSDYAMQNIIMQIKIPLLDISGKIIKKIKNYVLECYSCNNITRKLGVLFCPCCKYNTLLKVTCEFDQEGNLKLFKKKNFTFNKKGKRYNIPQPKGGRKENDLILNEDQLNDPNIKRMMKKNNRNKEKEFLYMNNNYEMGLGFEMKKKNNNNYGVQIGYGRKNPNDNQFWKHKKKRK